MVIHEQWLRKHYSEIKPKDFYRIIFPEGALEKKGEQVKGRYNGIMCENTDIVLPAKGGKEERTLTRRYMITDELDAIDIAAESKYFCFCSPISYAGKARTAKNARYLYALTFDVDNMLIIYGQPVGLAELLDETRRKMWADDTHNILPLPTFIVSSGRGVHLYYVLDKPIPLYPAYAEELQRYKQDLEHRILNKKVVIDENDTEHEGIYHPFRMPGSITKDGGRAVAFLTGERVTMDYLNQFVAPGNRAVNAAALTYVRGEVSLSEARKKWPEWYERRIKNKEPRKAIPIGRGLYDWWLKRIRTEARVGHRYWCLMTLAIFAKKCSYYDAVRNPNPVTYEELKRDANKLLSVFDAQSTDENNRFTEKDIYAALKAYSENNIKSSRATAERRTGITIKTKTSETKLHQIQEEHLADARAVRDARAKRRGVRWDENNGRKNKAEAVIAWRREHPDGSKADCIRDTGITDKTVAKWWNGAAAENPRSSKTGRTLEQITQSAKKHIENLRETLRVQESEAEDMRLAIQMLPDGSAKEYIRDVLRQTEASIIEIKKALDESTNGGGGNVD